MQTDIDTQTIAKIITRIKAASGQEVDEEQIATILNNTLSTLKQQDPEKYLNTIKQLSEQLETVAAEISRLQVQS